MPAAGGVPGCGCGAADPDPDHRRCGAGFDETTLRSRSAGEKKHVHGAVTEEYPAFWPGARSLDSMADAGIVVSDRYQNYFHPRWEHVAGNQACLLVKEYGSSPKDPENTKYSPSPIKSITVRKVSGSPDPAHISTSYVERQNITIRMGMRRFTRLTNGFSKKVENLTAAVSLHFMYYNFARPHMTLNKRYGTPTTPAIAAGKADHVWSLTEIPARFKRRFKLTHYRKFAAGSRN